MHDRKNKKEEINNELSVLREDRGWKYTLLINKDGQKTRVELDELEARHLASQLEDFLYQD